ncbi:MAG TPA: hypothetical protein DCS87_12310 [Rheinheimera sp.]|nr:hypothetical protein [Rheinheimera sp.]
MQRSQFGKVYLDIQPLHCAKTSQTTLYMAGYYKADWSEQASALPMSTACLHVAGRNVSPKNAAGSG